jgi:hypothetical protein
METINTLHHYGDSFGTWFNPDRPNESATVGFSEIIAEHLNLNHRHRAEGGLSNYIIVSRIVEDMFKFQYGDILLINFSFFHRFPIMLRPFENGDITSLSHSIASRGGNNLEKLPEEYLKYNLLHRTNFQEEEWNLLFHSFIKPIFKSLKERGIMIVVSFNNPIISDKNENYPMRRFLHQEPFSESSLMNVFTMDYIRLLNLRKLLKDGEDVHYKFGKQSVIAQLWIDYIRSIKTLV